MRCFNGLVERTDYPNLEVIVVVNNVPDVAAAKAFLAKWPFTVRVWEGAFNWSAINNFGAKHATGDYLLFLNDDVEPLDPDWLKHMVRIARMQCCRSGRCNTQILQQYAPACWYYDIESCRRQSSLRSSCVQILLGR